MAKCIIILFFFAKLNSFIQATLLLKHLLLYQTHFYCIAILYNIYLTIYNNKVNCLTSVYLYIFLAAYTYVWIIKSNKIYFWKIINNNNSNDTNKIKKEIMMQKKKIKFCLVGWDNKKSFLFINKFNKNYVMYKILYK